MDHNRITTSISLKKKKDIWFIHDDLAYRFLVHFELKEKPFGGRVRMFDDGDVAVLELIEIFRSKKEKLPMVIFAKICCARFGAWRLVDTLKELGIHIPVVLISAEPSRTDMNRIEREPLIMGLVPKENDPASVLNKIEDLLSADVE